MFLSNSLKILPIDNDIHTILWNGGARIQLFTVYVDDAAMATTFVLLSTIAGSRNRYFSTICNINDVLIASCNLNSLPIDRNFHIRFSFPADQWIIEHYEKQIPLATIAEKEDS